jgi:patatin-like phospholipase/acyl hydrolase
MISNGQSFKLLSIDGGGIKGLIPSQILYRIETEFGVNLYNFFDAYSGTSAGSMIIGAIAYNKATGKDLVEKLLPDSSAKKMMKQTIKDVILNVIQINPKYDGIEKRKIIDDNVGKKLLGHTSKYVLIPSYNISLERTVFFKSWEQTTGDYKVSDIIDASSAAPSYFPGIKIDGHYYIDGAISANNPTDSMYCDMLSLRPGDHIKILSLGTGFPEEKENKKNIRFWGGIQWALHGNLINILMKGPEKIVQYRTDKFTKSLGHEYLRIDGIIKNTSIDDTSDNNLKELRKIGDEWFETHRSELKKFFIE